MTQAAPPLAAGQRRAICRQQVCRQLPHLDMPGFRVQFHFGSGQSHISKELICSKHCRQTPLTALLLMRWQSSICIICITIDDILKDVLQTRSHFVVQRNWIGPHTVPCRTPISWWDSFILVLYLYIFHHELLLDLLDTSSAVKCTCTLRVYDGFLQRLLHVIDKLLFVHDTLSSSKIWLASDLACVRHFVGLHHSVMAEFGTATNW